MLLAVGEVVTIGVDSGARVWFDEGPKAPGSWAGRRFLYLDEAPAFELSYWCGTCRFLFERLEGANRTLSISKMESRLAEGLDGLDDDVIGGFGRLLPRGDYVPMLLELQPALVRPGEVGDYFHHEQVATWGVNPFWDLPHHSRAVYYRTHECEVDDGAHLFEFVVPMVPPSWNDSARVSTHRERLRKSTSPTTVAVSTLDVCQPAVADDARDNFAHWGLTHFVLDGHHKLEAAAAEQRTLRMLSLMSIDASLATSQQVARTPHVRAGPRSGRRPEAAGGQP